MSQKFKVVGLGNALMDALYRLEDDTLLEEHTLRKGEMHQVDHTRWMEVYDQLVKNKVHLQTGGSCANTIATLGLMGLKVSFCSKVGGDELGEEYKKQLIHACGQHDLLIQADASTGKCLSLISPNAERTMLTDLAVSIQLDSIEHFQQSLQSTEVLYLTGYLMFGKMRARLYEAIAIAKDAGAKIALDVADPSVVAVCRAEMLEIIKEHVDIVFLNKAEAQALCGGTPESAIEALAAYCSVVVVKLGAEGSLVRMGEEQAYADIFSVEAIDTTGAGDSYAAGFLYAYLQGWPLEVMVRLASRVAAQAVSQLGAVVRDREILRNILMEMAHEYSL